MAFSLFLLIDAVGNIPLFVSMLKDIPPKKQYMIITRELIIALVVIVFFAFVGEHILKLLGIDQRTVSIAGGIILFIIALRMIFPEHTDQSADAAHKGEPFIVPFAIPLVAGPAVLASVIIYSHKVAPYRLIGAISIAWLASSIILLSSPFLKKILGDRGVAATERLMGLLLTLISVQMFISGLSAK